MDSILQYFYKHFYVSLLLCYYIFLWCVCSVSPHPRASLISLNFQKRKYQLDHGKQLIFSENIVTSFITRCPAKLKELRNLVRKYAHTYKAIAVRTWN